MVLSLEERKDIEQQNSQVQFDIGAHEENDYLIMTIYDERYPDHKRNLLLEVEKNPEWWEWKDNK